MKFRGLMLDTSAMKDFMNINISLTKFAKDCVMRITSKKVYFIISEENSGTRNPLVWCELPVSFYFKEFNLAGISEEFNEIYLEFSTAMFSRSLSTLRQPTKSLKLKLTNKQTPCITMEIEQIAGESMQNRQLVHDIPVEVIAHKHWNDYAEPRFNEFHVSIQMPSLRSIKNIVERMKQMSHNLIVSANQNGKLTLKIETNMVTLSAHFCDLNVESFAVEEISTMKNREEMEGESVSASVDIKKFLMFLTGMQINSCKTICSIVQGSMVKLFLQQPGVLTFQIFLTELSI